MASHSFAVRHPEHADFIKAVTSTNYDMLVMDLYGEDGISFTTDEIQELKLKANGGKFNFAISILRHIFAPR